MPNVAKTITASNGVPIAFLEYVPSGTGPFPLIVYMHGISERGDGTVNTVFSVEANEIPKLIKNNAFPYNFIVLSPQLKNTYGAWQNFYASTMITYAKANLNVDTTKIYITGLSLGGGGVWETMKDMTIVNQVAAIAPVCGTCTWNSTSTSNIVTSSMPVWAFHCQDDTTVSAGCSTGSLTEINKLNPVVKPKMSLYKTGGHGGAWVNAYSTGHNTYTQADYYNNYVTITVTQNPNLYEWFLLYTKGTPPPPPPPTKTLIATIKVYNDGTIDKDNKPCTC